MRYKNLLLLLLAFFLMWGGNLFAGYQDLAVDMYAVTTEGVPLDGEKVVTYRLFADSDDQGTENYLLESTVTETFVDGSLRAKVDVSAIVGDIPNALFLEITIDGDTLDLVEMNGVFWAVRAGVCESLSSDYLASAGFLASIPAGATGETGATGPAGAAGPAGAIAADSVALTTNTTGNYVGGVTNGAGITGGDGGSEGAALTLAVNQAFAPTWTGNHTFNGATTFNAALTVGANDIVGTTGLINYTNFDVDAAGNVTIGGTLTTTGMSRTLLPATQALVAGDTITANGCGTVKRISSAAIATTNTTDTFTAPAATNEGCCMDVINVGVFAITLDNNANFRANAADIALAANSAVRVCSTGAGGAWYQITAVEDNP